MSNFSFYFAHHLSTIEGGMVCTNDAACFETLRMLRSHGMVREMSRQHAAAAIIDAHPDLSPDFIFMFPAYNVRNTEIGAVIGRSQLPRLDRNNAIRNRNFRRFLDHLDPEKYRTDFDLTGMSNYAFNLVLQHPDTGLRDRVEKLLRETGVEFRRGSSGGGNQLRQPYLRKRFPEIAPEGFPNVEHIHFFGYYIGNYPDLETEQIQTLCKLLNRL
jgi:CDP-6-deoxy-D-xylo-4-hexulose-3-dehydrase